MNKGRLVPLRRISPNIFIVLALLVLSACGGGGGGLPSGIGANTDPATARVTVSASTVLINRTVDVSVTIKDERGRLVPDGTAVTFSISAGFGTVDPASATTVAGIATTTVNVSGKSGTAVVTAKAGSVSSTAIFTVVPSDAPAKITLTASPSSTTTGNTSSVSATVLTSSDSNVPDGTTVNFSVNDTTLGSITDSARTVNGRATATFTAKTKIGTAKITAVSGAVSTISPLNITIDEDPAPATVTVVANPSSITVEGTSSIKATVNRNTGNPVPDGTVVNFSSSNAALGTISAQASTAGGVATALFRASATQTGSTTVTAASGSVSGNVAITVNPPATGSIVFLSATPSNIGLADSGRNTVSEIKFNVFDFKGRPVPDGTGVDFCLTGPAGGRVPPAGEYLNERDTITEAFTDTNGNGCYDTGEPYKDLPADGGDGNGRYTSPVHAAVSTVGGVAMVNLNSGLVAGNVSLKATVTGTGISSSTPVISIGGGVASATHFSLSVSKFNLETDFDGVTTSINTLVADRFGNANVLAGTTVSYYTEAGATLTSSTTLDTTGATTVQLRTQDPRPRAVTPIGGSTVCPGRAALWFTFPTSWESCLSQYVFQDYGITTSGHPRNGWVSVVVALNGEEHFDDLNGNGKYDAGEPFTDTPQEPFVDFNDNDTYNSGVYGPDPAEIFIDKNGNGKWDGNNGKWDASKTIFENVRLIFSDKPSVIGLSRWDGTKWIACTGSGCFNVPNGGKVSLKALVADSNLNPLAAGATIAISTDQGALSGEINYSFPDVGVSRSSSGFQISGPKELLFEISDADAATNAATAATLTITVSRKGIDYNKTFSGTVN